MAHARNSPSAAKIWMACPAMPGMAEKVAPTTSPYAEEGTAAHALAEVCLKEGENARDYTGKHVSGHKVTDEMAIAVQVYVDYVRKNTAEGDEHGYEQRLKFNDHLWGTADFIRYRPETRHLLVADYKHGAGVFVGVEQNPQALTYAVMAAKNLGNRGVDKVTLAIVQPRCGEGDGVREWEFDAVDLLEWNEELVAAIERTLAEKPAFVPGSHCRWCPAAAICPALKKKAQETAKQDFAPALAYDPNELADALEAVPMMEAWIKATHSFAFAEAQHGRGSPRHKLVAKRPSRKWADEKQTIEFLETYGMDGKDIFDRSLRSPAQVEKILGKQNKDAVKDLIVSVSSGATLAPIDDPRPAVAGDAAMDFTPVEVD
jgi:hypothetical protein